MNRTKQISIPQLVELASLDAFGLLDAEDSLTFEDALLAAPARIRDSIRELQAELVSEDPLLSSEEPDETLREKVMQRVSQAMAERDETLQPLAQIGPADDSSRESIENRSFSQSIWTWRAVALVLLGVSITLAVFGIVADRNHRELIQAINNRQADFTMNQAPGAMAQIAWPTDNGVYRVVSLVDPDGDSGRIRFFMNEDGSNPRVAYDLNVQTEPLTIYAIDDEGEFGPKGGEYVIAHLNPMDTSASVVDTFDSKWIGNTRLVARTADGRDVMIQI
ncbi:MAG: hypothetical protein CMJ40_07620 [Phycisphaerae bacterium]|nr:hypothetical protein [Phycisphaerae bacterium]|tara:strand:+ start:1548 stop:2381 length:834 start_codon:yes stop_codon:yes gene_type:complete